MSVMQTKLKLQQLYPTLKKLVRSYECIRE